MNRTKNATRNIFYGFINKFIVLLFPFLIRSALIKSLGSEYLGLSSLFTSILQVLNLTELGFSSAVVFCLYKPIAKNDTDTICALLNFYKKVYRVIGIIILVVGLSITPFITNLIKGTYPTDINIYILYFLYLINTAITYFLFAYKSTLLIAHQRSDITSNINTFVNIPMYIIQIIVLLYLKNYYIFVIILILSTIINNIICAIIAKKKFPNYRANGKIDDRLKKDIKKRVQGLMIQRLCVTTRNSLDSIFISAYLGLNIVAVYNNYYSIISALVGIMSICTSAITAGIGNSIVTESEEKNYNDMKKFIFIYMIIVGIITVCLASLYQNFMTMWMGKKYLLNSTTVILLCIYFYSLEIGVIRGAYSDAKGLWWENRYRAILETICNIVLNWLLVSILGLNGVIIGTLISILLVNFAYGSQILFKHYFINQNSKEYYFSHLLYAFITTIISIIVYVVNSYIKIDGIIGFGVKGIISVLLALIMYFIVYRKTNNYKETKKFIKQIIYSIKKQTKN